MTDPAPIDSSPTAPTSTAAPVTPSPNRSVKRWAGMTGLAVVISTLLFSWLVFVPQYKLSQEIAKLGGTVAWHKPVGGIQAIRFMRGGADADWVETTKWETVFTLSQLTLKSCGLTDECLKKLLVLDKLTELDLERNPELTTQGLGELQAMAGLQRLNISLDILVADEFAIPRMSRLSKLPELNIYAVEMDPELLKRLRETLPNTHIEVVNPTASGMAMRPIPSRALVRTLFHPSGKWLAAGDAEGVLRVWNLERNELVWTHPAHDDWLFGLAFDPTGRILATSGGDDSIRLWDFEQRSLLATLHGHEDDVHAVTFTPDGRSLISSSDDMTTRRWGVADLESLRRDEGQEVEGAEAVWEGHEDTIPTLAISHNGQWLATGSRDGTVRMRDLRTGQESHVLVHSTHKRPRDERGLSIGAFDPDHPRGDVMGISFHPSDSSLATTGYDGQVQVWEIATGQSTTSWPAHKGWAFGVEFSPEGKQLATCGRGGVIALWGPNGERQRDLQADDDVACVTFSPDGSQLAACTCNGQLQLYSLADSQGNGTQLLP